MLRASTKKALLGILTAGILVLRLSIPALADATDQTALEASQSGVNYLAANQSNDGSISGSLGGTTDWSVMALEAHGQDPAVFNNGSGTSALDFLKADTPTPTTTATDVERKIIAIVDTGQDPKSFGGINYYAVLAGYYNNQQIGDPTLLNDDIFGVIAASAAPDPTLRGIAQDSLNYFLAHQGADGGFSYTTDSCPYCGSDSSDTAAAIIAMQAASSSGLSNADLASDQSKAQSYLLSTQQPDGGFASDIYSPSNGDSTAWSLMALNSIGSTVQAQALTARDWLLADQNNDGGFSYGAYGITTSDTYTTAHAILALLGTTWLLQPAPIHASSTPASTPVIAGTGGNSPTAGSTDPLVTTSSSPTLQANTQPISSSTPPAAGNGAVLGTQADNLGADANILQATKSDSKRAGAALAESAIPSSRYTEYAAVLLGLAALGWYILQSKLKREEA